MTGRLPIHRLAEAITRKRDEARSTCNGCGNELRQGPQEKWDDQFCDQRCADDYLEATGY